MYEHENSKSFKPVDEINEGIFEGMLCRHYRVPNPVHNSYPVYFIHIACFLYAHVSLSSHASLPTGPGVKGKFGADLVQIGPIQLEDQLFAQIESFNKKKFFSCESVDGVLGLNHMNMDDPKIATPIQSIGQNLKYPMFSIYYNEIDDFSFDDNDSSVKHHSEIIFGGVNQLHYMGCLQWYDLGQHKDEVRMEYGFFLFIIIFKFSV